jgi:catechol 2,3-dioxygenase-like lactoylglutathione lyase family enzyme
MEDLEVCTFECSSDAKALLSAFPIVENKNTKTKLKELGMTLKLNTGNNVNTAKAESRIQQIHHVAYRCKDAKETVLWYERMLGMTFQLAFSEDHVPSTGALDPYMHVFLDAGAGNVLAFFELPDQPTMGRDENTPAWVQHIAFEVANRPELERQKTYLEAQGLDVIGITNHGAFHSIYFFDPSGHRLELTYRDANEAAIHQQLDAVKWAMLEEWSITKRAPKLGLNHAAFANA